MTDPIMTDPTTPDPTMSEAKTSDAKTTGPITPAPGLLEERIEEIKASIVFCTRLPLLRPAPIAGVAIGKAAWTFPLAGLLIGLIAAAVYALAHKLGLPSWPAATLTVAATLLATGCLHEDGLADTADGFGGGKTREQKLAIMRDSRIGTYGVCALVLSLLIRIGALASFFDTRSVLWALIAAHVGARAAMPALMFLLKPARSDGLSFAAGHPSGNAVAIALAIGFIVLAIALRPLRGIVALIGLGVVILLMAWLSNRQIDGQTGDVIGALEQASEVVILLVALG
ncbi:MAG TPA: adenosylcobinamide-GDP ribazoletransferase [Xanthobacteraceae bacterium]|jgi:adenosylcobinamide-GDP ribazoletransferase|nr:adenosylcobinamide-GDP ribazoletransferase [Xanthobacteraceae bacterium]